MVWIAAPEGKKQSRKQSRGVQTVWIMAPEGKSGLEKWSRGANGLDYSSRGQKRPRKMV
jgi:hypothetical protein